MKLSTIVVLSLVLVSSVACGHKKPAKKDAKMVCASIQETIKKNASLIRQLGNTANQSSLDILDTLKKFYNMTYEIEELMKKNDVKKCENIEFPSSKKGQDGQFIKSDIDITEFHDANEKIAQSIKDIEKTLDKGTN